MEYGMQELQEGGDIRILMADSLRYTAETNSILKQFSSNKERSVEVSSS